MKIQRGLAVAVSILIIFAALARGAHDLWSATAVYFAVLVLSLAILFLSVRAEGEPLRLPMAVPAVLVAAALGISFAQAANPADAFLGLMDGLCALLLFLVAANVFISEKPVDHFLLFLLPCLWIEFGVVIWQISAITEREKMGTLVNGNLLCAFALPWALVFAGRVMEDWKKDRSHALAWASGAAAALGCLAFAQSSAAVIALLAGAALLSLRYRESALLRPLFRRWPWFAAAIAAAVVWVVADKFTRVYDPVLYPNRDTSNRFYWWKSAALMFRDHPWFGVGPGNFPAAYLAYKVGGKENTLFVHSAPLTWLAETGMVGFAAIASFFAAWIARARTGWRTGTVRLEFLPAVSAMVIFTSVSIGLEYQVNLMVLMVLMALTVAPVETFQVKPRPSVFIVALVGVLAAVPYVVSPFLASRSTVDGEAALQKKDLAGAEKSFFNAIRIDPRAWEPYAGLARVAFEKGDDAVAEEFQAKALERNRLSLPLKRQMEIYRRRRR